MEDVEEYCKGSGSKVNEDKTVYTRFGKAMVLGIVLYSRKWKKLRF